MKSIVLPTDATDTPPIPSSAFKSFTISQQQLALEILTVSYTKHLSFHFACEFCYPEGRQHLVRKGDKEVLALIEKACQMRRSMLISTIYGLSSQLVTEEINA